MLEKSGAESAISQWPAVLLTPRQAATTLAISARKLWSLTASGELKAIRIGRSVRYAPADLDAFVAELRSAQEAT